MATIEHNTVEEGVHWVLEHPNDTLKPIDPLTTAYVAFYIFLKYEFLLEMRFSLNFTWQK